MPPRVALPSCAGSVANRFALRRSSSNVSAVDAPSVFEIVAAPNRSARGSNRGSPSERRRGGGSCRSLRDLRDGAWADSDAVQVSGAFMISPVQRGRIAPRGDGPTEPIRRAAASNRASTDRSSAAKGSLHVLAHRAVAPACRCVSARRPSLAQPLPLDRIRLPPGFTIELVARVPGAREMAFGANGTLFVGLGERRRLCGRAATRATGSAQASVRKIASGLREPAGVAFRDGALYVSAVSRILRFDDIERAARRSAAAGRRLRRLSDRRPSRLEVHRVRSRRQAVRAGRRAVQHLRARPRPLREHHAHECRRLGPRDVRARHPQHASASTGIRRTRELWFTDNGRDKLGDDVPPDTLNHAPKAGARFRLSVLPRGDDRGSGIRRASKPCSEFAPPAQRARPARRGARACGSTRARSFPQRYRGQIFIAEHGSWNRSAKIGYRVTHGQARRQPASRSRTSRLPKAGCRASKRGAGPRTWSWRPTARCWSPTIPPARSTGSGIAVDPRQ